MDADFSGDKHGDETMLFMPKRARKDDVRSAKIDYDGKLANTSKNPVLLPSQSAAVLLSQIQKDTLEKGTPPIANLLSRLSFPELDAIEKHFLEIPKQDIDRRLPVLAGLACGSVIADLEKSAAEIASFKSLLEAAFALWFRDAYFEETSGRMNLDRFRNDVKNAGHRSMYSAGAHDALQHVQQQNAPMQ